MQGKRKKTVYVNKCNTSKKKNRKKRVKNCKIYSEKLLQQALEELEKGSSFRSVSKEYSIPLATLHRRKKNPVLHKKKPAVLTCEEEQEIAFWIIQRARMGCPVTKNELLENVEIYLKHNNRPNPFNNNRPGRAWYEGFRRRNPEVTIRTAQSLESCREDATEDDLRGWFATIKDYLEKKNLLNIDPSRVWNCDETSLPLNPKPSKVLAEKGAAVVYQTVEGSDKDNLSVLFNYAADGTRGPPLVLYKYKQKIPEEIIKSMPPGWGIGLSEGGYMQRENFFEYVTNVWFPFLEKIGVEFPVILYCDGHTSHISIPLVSFCREKQIEILHYYPHSTHLCQPLDIAYFCPLKQKVWPERTRIFRIKNNRRGLKKEEFAPLLLESLNSWDTEKQVVISGFKASGTYPLDPNVIKYDKLKKKKTKKVTGISANKPNINQALIPTPTTSTYKIDSGPVSEVSNESHLKFLELYIPTEILEKFKDCNEWASDDENAQLFKVWSQMRNEIYSSNPIGKYV